MPGQNEKNGEGGQDAVLQVENQRDRLKQIAVQKAGVWQQQRKRRGGTGDEIQKAIERPFLQQRCKQAHKQVDAA